jgi:hypothetical protein
MDWEQVIRDYQIVSRVVECLPAEMTSLSPEDLRERLAPATVTRIMIQRHAATDISPVC